MYTVKHGGDIQKGDLIAVSNGNDFTVGIYFGRGTGGTVQYYRYTTPKHCKERYNNRVISVGAEKAGTFTIKNLWKDFLNTPRDTRILKLNRYNITDEKVIKDILEAKEILQELNITVNY
jgi:hypothetical protein